MRKIFLFIIVAFILIPLTDVYASGSINVSTTSLTIPKGETRTFTISANNAAGNVLIQSANGNVATAKVSGTGESNYFFDTSLGNSSTTIVVTGVSEGQTQINIVLDDVGTFDNEELTGIKVVSIKVEEVHNQEESNPQPNPEPSTPANNTPSNNTNNNSSNSTNTNRNNNTNTNNNTTTKQEEKKEEEKKEEVKVEKKLKVDKFEIIGYDLAFNVDKTQYELDILDGLNDLYIIVEGENLQVTGDKKVSILGKDKIEVEIKSEDISKKYIIKLNRISKNSIIVKQEDPKDKWTTLDKILLTTTLVFLSSTLGLGTMVILNKKKNVKIRRINGEKNNS